MELLQRWTYPPATDYNAEPITNSGSFKYKSSITGKTLNANQEDGENTEHRNKKTKKNIEIVVLLKHLSNFWRILHIPLINCEFRGGSGAAATSKMKRFVIIVINGLQPLTIIAKRPTLDVSAVPDPPLEVSLTLTWSENCVLTEITTQAARNAHPNADLTVEARESMEAPTNITFKITDTKLYVPVDTLTTEDDNNFLEQLK